ncbi:hypothetical protein [Candidatus Harpocratesius sp.]
MPKYKHKKSIFFILQLFIFSSLAWLFYWDSFHHLLTQPILFAILTIYLSINILSGWSLTKRRNCIPILQDPLPEAWALSVSNRIHKQKALQLLYFDIKMQNWAGFIQHSRDLQIKDAVQDFAELMTHPTKRYSRMLTSKFELRINGYEGKAAEIVDRNTKQIYSLEENNKKNNNQNFSTVLEQLQEDYLEYYSIYMIDPLKSLNEFANLLFNHEYALIFGKAVKFAEIFDREYFKCIVGERKFYIKLKTTDQSKFELVRHRKKFKMQLILTQGESVQKINWTTNLCGELVSLNQKSSIRKKEINAGETDESSKKLSQAEITEKSLKIPPKSSKKNNNRKKRVKFGVISRNDALLQK